MAYCGGVRKQLDADRAVDDKYIEVHASNPLVTLARRPKAAWEWKLVPEAVRREIKVKCPYPDSGMSFGEAMKSPSAVKRFVCIMCHGEMPPENRCKEKLECPKCFYPGVKKCIGGCTNDDFL